MSPNQKQTVFQRALLLWWNTAPHKEGQLVKAKPYIQVYDHIRDEEKQLLTAQMKKAADV